MLPRPFAVLFALALAGATAVAISLLPARATLQLTVPRPAPSSAGPAPAALLGRSTYVRFVDTAAEPGFDLPADARRSGVRWYALGHLVAGPDGCTSRWAGRLDFGHDPVAKRIGGLRAVGADAGLVFGGPDGGEPAATCTRPGALAAAYRRVVGAFDADYIDFDLRTDSERSTAGDGGAAGAGHQGDAAGAAAAGQLHAAAAADGLADARPRRAAPHPRGGSRCRGRQPAGRHRAAQPPRGADAAGGRGPARGAHPARARRTTWPIRSTPGGGWR